MEKVHVIVEASPNNQLLRVLSKDDHELVIPALETVTLVAKQVIEAPSLLLTHAYFVDSGLISVMANSWPKRPIEIGMVGSEGMIGQSLVLGADRTPNVALVQSAGSARRIAASELRRLIHLSPTLAASLLIYVNVFLVQVGQTALALGQGKLIERLARWLLMWHDRHDTDHLAITHDALAKLLSVRRPGMSVLVAELEGLGVIKARRGAIRIIDRVGLIEISQGLYGVPEAEYRRLLACPADSLA